MGEKTVDVPSTFPVDGNAWGFNAGLLYRGHGFRIGVNYRSGYTLEYAGTVALNVPTLRSAVRGDGRDELRLPTSLTDGHILRTCRRRSSWPSISTTSSGAPTIPTRSTSRSRTWTRRGRSRSRPCGRTAISSGRASSIRSPTGWPCAAGPSTTRRPAGLDHGLDAPRRRPVRRDGGIPAIGSGS